VTLTVRMSGSEIEQAVKAWIKLHGYVLKPGCKPHFYTCSIDGSLTASAEVEPPGQPKMLAEGPYR
jgi:hypothetical protein